jgi:hypothetical protein
MCRIWIFPVACFCVGVIALSGAATDAPKPEEKAPKKVTKEEVKAQMIAAHRGEKSPLARTEAELKKDAPNWEQLGKDAKEFAKMAELLKMAPPAYTDATKYITSTADFEKAATGKDTQKAVAALMGLRKSCSACHYGIPK